jgi:hypothetical protein
MKVHDFLIQDLAGSDVARLTIDESRTDSTSQKTQGIWLLFLRDVDNDDIIQTLRQSVKHGVFHTLVTDKSVVKFDGPKKLVTVMEEGYVNRPRLWDHLRSFDRMGVEGDWMYCDVGSQRDEKARRLLIGTRPLGPVTEIIYRRDGDRRIVREVPFGRR